MATHWRTEPVGGQNSSQRQRIGPQIYVHVEFGVSLCPTEAPRHHELTYRSRTLRDRFPNFPRRLPAPNTNYLAYSPDTQQSRRPQPHEYTLNDLQAALPPVALGTPTPQNGRAQGAEDGHENEELRQSSRSGSRTSSHGRGQSEPPPCNYTSWDVYEPMPAPGLPATLPATRLPPEPELWKDLPEVPSRYRLGEAGLPWSPFSWPMGCEPSAYPQEPDAASPSTHASQTREVPMPQPTGDEKEDEQATETRPTEDNVQQSNSPIHFLASPVFHPSSHPQNRRELESLSAAMVTVDNGFEDQWWNRGDRSNLSPDEPPVPPLNRPIGRLSSRSLGWAVASAPTGRLPAEVRDYGQTTLSNADMLVSPATYQGSPPPRYYLARSMSTRSEELGFVDGAGYFRYNSTPMPEHWSAGYYA